jgi:hypothetical protein
MSEHFTWSCEELLKNEKVKKKRDKKMSCLEAKLETEKRPSHVYASTDNAANNGGGVDHVSSLGSFVSLALPERRCCLRRRSLRLCSLARAPLPERRYSLRLGSIPRAPLFNLVLPERVGGLARAPPLSLTLPDRLKALAQAPHLSIMLLLLPLLSCIVRGSGTQITPLQVGLGQRLACAQMRLR